MKKTCAHFVLFLMSVFLNKNAYTKNEKANTNFIDYIGYSNLFVGLELELCEELSDPAITGLGLGFGATTGLGFGVDDELELAATGLAFELGIGNQKVGIVGAGGDSSTMSMSSTY